jgi:hypothetical protein
MCHAVAAQKNEPKDEKTKDVCIELFHSWYLMQALCKGR